MSQDTTTASQAANDLAARVDHFAATYASDPSRAADDLFAVLVNVCRTTDELIEVSYDLPGRVGTRFSELLGRYVPGNEPLSLVAARVRSLA